MFGEEEVTEPWEAAFCLITPPPHSQMFSNKVKATRKSSGREELEMALGRFRDMPSRDPQPIIAQEIGL